MSLLRGGPPQGPQNACQTPQKWQEMLLTFRGRSDILMVRKKGCCVSAGRGGRIRQGYEW